MSKLARAWIAAAAWVAVAPLGGAALSTVPLAPRSPDAATAPRTHPRLVPMTGPVLSRAVRDLPRAAPRAPAAGVNEIHPLLHSSLTDAGGRRFGTVAPRRDDPLVGLSALATGASPDLLFGFEGLDNVDGFLPPDPEGAVGPDHYVQVVNVGFAIFDKSGFVVQSRVHTNTLWTGFGGLCETNNDGNATVLYDEQADRFVITQFAADVYNPMLCFAVSTTPDPTGTYSLYALATERYPDYAKVAVWPDPENSGYYVGTNSGAQNQYDVYALDREKMLAGLAARPAQYFQDFPNFLMPADVDGPELPPAGAPALFYTFRDGGEPYFGSPATDSLDVFEFDVDWDNGANSTMTLDTSITPDQGLEEFNWTVCGFYVANCLPQPDTAATIDSESWYPMYRLVYRRFDSFETLVGTWTVDTLAIGDHAAPRWFELRREGAGWTLHQQGTQAPDSRNRWMGSIAMDGQGNIALGYSRGDGSSYPSIYYATRLASDPLGTLQSEKAIIDGTGSQTHSSGRWGGYSSMELDPSDDCTFWYTNEYYSTTGLANWRTRIGVFKLPGCLPKIFLDGFESGDTLAWSSAVP